MPQLTIYQSFGVSDVCQALLRSTIPKCVFASTKSSFHYNLNCRAIDLIVHICKYRLCYTIVLNLTAAHAKCSASLFKKAGMPNWEVPLLHLTICSVGRPIWMRSAKFLLPASNVKRLYVRSLVNRDLAKLKSTVISRGCFWVSNEAG